MFPPPFRGVKLGGTTSSSTFTTRAQNVPDPQDVELEILDAVVDLGTIPEERLVDQHADFDEQNVYDKQKEQQLGALLDEERKLHTERYRRRILALKRKYERKVTIIQQNTRERDVKTRQSINRKYVQTEDQMLHDLQKEGTALMKKHDLQVHNRWLAEWTHAPQPIVVKLKALRGLKDKVPEGFYVVLCTIYDRIGGTPVAFEGTVENQCRGATNPIFYPGKWYTAEMLLDTKLHIVVPSPQQMQSHIVLVFELWRLKRGKYNPIDKVVAWGVFPIVNGNFKIVTGSFKTAFLKGPLDLSVDRYTRLQKIYEHDNKYWSCNLYFEIHLDKERLMNPNNALYPDPETMRRAREEENKKLLEDHQQWENEVQAKEQGELDHRASLAIQAAQQFNDLGFDEIEGEEYEDDGADDDDDFVEEGEEETDLTSQDSLVPKRKRMKKTRRRQMPTDPVELELYRIFKRRKEEDRLWALEDEEEDILRERRHARRERQRAKEEDEERTRRRIRHKKGMDTDDEEKEVRRTWRRRRDRELGIEMEEEKAFEQERKRKWRQRMKQRQLEDIRIEDLKKSLDRKQKGVEPETEQQAMQRQTVKIGTAEVLPITREEDYEEADGDGPIKPDGDATVAAEQGSFGEENQKQKEVDDEWVEDGMTAAREVGEHWKHVGLSINIQPRQVFYERKHRIGEPSSSAGEANPWQAMKGESGRKASAEASQLKRLKAAAKVTRKRKHEAQVEVEDIEAQQRIEEAWDEAQRRLREDGGGSEGSDLDIPEVAQAIKMENDLAMQEAMQAQDTVTQIAISSLTHQQSVCSRRQFLEGDKQFREKLPFITTILFYDMGINATGAWNFKKLGVSAVMCAICIWLRMFGHNLGTWMWLSSNQTPRTKEVWTPAWVEIQWRVQHYLPSHEVIAVASGVVCNVAIFYFLVTASVLSQLLFHHFPYIASRFVLWYGIAAFLDPFILASTDTIRANWSHGEAFILYHYFQKAEGSGISGALITLAVYFQTCVLALGMLYKYCSSFHLNGRINDTYNRLMLPENSFFIPNDLEVSKAELELVVDASKKWRSDLGDLRHRRILYLSEKRMDLFRERLWALLSAGRGSSTAVAYSQPTNLSWITEYLQTITLRLRRAALVSNDRKSFRFRREGYRYNLGSFKLGSDIRDYLRRKHPYLLSDSTDNNFLYRPQDSYWDQSMYEMEDLSSVFIEERKEFISLLFLWLSVRCSITANAHKARAAVISPDSIAPESPPQSRKPCFWVSPEEAASSDSGSVFLPNGASTVQDLESGAMPLLGGMPTDIGTWTQFKVLDAQLLADFVFFETSGSGTRLNYLKELFISNGIDANSFWKQATSSRRKDAITLVLPGFNSHDRASSVRGQDVTAGYLTINTIHAATRQADLFRQFIITPSGSIIEPLTKNMSNLEVLTDLDNAEERAFKRRRLRTKINFGPEDPEFWVIKISQEQAQLQKIGEDVTENTQSHSLQP